jgi:hypothetical protein
MLIAFNVSQLFNNKNLYFFINIMRIQFSRWPPTDVNTKVYLNQGMRSIFFALKPDYSTSFPIGQLTYILEREQAKTLIKIEFDVDRITAALKKSENIIDRVRNYYLKLRLILNGLTA